MQEIINKVDQSGLITINLEDFSRGKNKMVVDIKKWLFEEIILKEKDFRASIISHNWLQYKNHYVAITCTADAIVPTWAYMLVASALKPFAAKVVFGDVKKLSEEIFNDAINSLDATEFTNKRIVIKGCSDGDIPVSAYVNIIIKLQSNVKSIMYGEPCSTVPVYKQKIV